MKFEKNKTHKSFEGETAFCEHESKSTQTKMKFSYFLPATGKVDRALVWLSGLTCNEENFISKAGAQKELAATNTMVICPDTSPRGLDLPKEHESYDFGSGAGFYLNATTQGYREHYRMYDYILNEIVPLLKSEFKIKHISISGHSMGGHGALILGLRNPDIFETISAFSPVANPMNCEWGKKAFSGYLGNDQAQWQEYDATELIKQGAKHPRPILIDQGTGDEFFPEQLRTQSFENACKEHGQGLDVNYREGYDHSYYFISSFITDHLKHSLQ